MEPKQQQPYPLRMPPELRAHLEDVADRAKRSLNAEIVDRLQASTGQNGMPASTASALAVAVARAELDVATTKLRAQEDLQTAALVARALVSVLTEVRAKNLQLESVDSAVGAAYDVAFSFLGDTKKPLGAIDIALRKARERIQALEDAERRMMAAVASVPEDLPPQRTLSFKGSSGKRTNISVTTKAARAPKP